MLASTIEAVGARLPEHIGIIPDGNAFRANLLPPSALIPFQHPR
jgi:hypothetical protein